MPIASEVQLNRYLTSLPDGPQGYHDCKVTAVLYLRLLHDEPKIKYLLDATPFFAIQQRMPLKEETFVPLTLHVAAVLAFAQIRKLNSEQMRYVLKQHGKIILSGPVYRRLFAILSPTLVTMGAGLRYSTDFKGVSASGKSTSKTTAKMTIKNPAHLFPNFYVESYNGIFEASLEAASAKNIVSVVDEVTATGSVSAFTWQS